MLRTTRLFRLSSSLRYSQIRCLSQNNVPEPELSRSVWTVPNIITMTRILSTPAIGYCITQGWMKPALAGLFLAGVSDVLDGYLAKRFGMGSILGSYLDPLADKFLIGTVTGTMAYAGLLPLWTVLIVVGRDAMLVTGTFYMRWKMVRESDPRWTWTQFFSPSAGRMHYVKPTLVSKLNTALQLSWMGTALLSATWGVPGYEVVNFLSYGVALTTIASGFDYMYLRPRAIKRY